MTSSDSHDRGFIDAADELAEIKKHLRDAAKPDCGGCDGSGIYMGNVCICACVSVSNIQPPKEDHDQL